MFREREDLDFYHQLRQIPDNQIREGGGVTLPSRKQPAVTQATKSAKAIVTIVAATIALGVLFASVTAQPGRVGGGTISRTDHCFNYSESNNWDGRFSLFWMPRATA